MNEKERLEKLIESENITQTQFADRIGIKRSTLSHIMNGRNAPSLDVLQKALNVFRSISADWLILGVGPMYRITNSQQQTLFDVRPEEPVEEKVTPSTNEFQPKQNETFVPIAKPTAEPENTTETAKNIVKIVVFYSDNTFEELKK